MSWQRGHAEVERLIADGELEQVAPSAEVASRLVADADAHIRLASRGTSEDPAGALQLCYDAARKAAAALLAVQGLRATTRGGHIAVIDAVRAQFNDRGGMEVFGRLHAMRRRRNRTEYPDEDSPGVDEHDAQHALNTAQAVIDAAKQLLDSGRLASSNRPEPGSVRLAQGELDSSAGVGRSLLDVDEPRSCDQAFLALAHHRQRRP